MPRNTAIFEPTFRGTAAVRSADILADPRYGKSEPTTACRPAICRCAAIWRCRSLSRGGEVLGGLFFGHAQPGMFTDGPSGSWSDLAAQAAVAIDNARLYQTSQREIAARKASGRRAAGAEPDPGTARCRSAREQLAASVVKTRGNRTALPDAGGRRHRLRDLHARSDGHGDQLEPGAERIKGYSRDEIIGQHFSRFYTEEDRAKRGSAEGARRPRRAPASTKPKAGGSARTEPGSGQASSSTRSATPKARSSALPRSRAT